MKAYTELDVKNAQIEKRLKIAQQSDEIKPSFVPLQLAKEMINKIPAKKPNDILVISDTGLLIETYRKWKNSNIIFLCHTKEAQEIANQLKVLSVFVPYLELDEWLKSEKIMKFDVIVENPPYQGLKGNQKFAPPIYQNFTQLIDFLKDGGYKASIHPTHWRWSGRPCYNKMKKTLFYFDILFLKTNLNVFSVTTDYYILKKQHTPNFLTNVNDSQHLNIKSYKDDLSQLTYVLNGVDTIISKYLKENLTYDNGYRKGKEKAFSYTTTSDKDNIYPYKAGTFLNNEKIAWFKKPHQHQFNEKILLSRIRKLNPYQDAGKYGVGGNCDYFLTETYNQEEKEILMKFLNGNVCAYIHKKFKPIPDDPNNNLSYLSKLDVKNLKNIKLKPEEINIINEITGEKKIIR